MKAYKKLERIVSSGARQVLFFMAPPYLGEQYILSSAIEVPRLGVRETYLFRSNPSGEIVTYQELGGSMRDVVDPEYPIRLLGYEIVEGNTVSHKNQEPYKEKLDLLF